MANDQRKLFKFESELVNSIYTMILKNLIFIFCLPLVLFGRQQTYSNYDTIPPLNMKILEFVGSKIGKKVDRGECWDLAAQALELAGANWNHQYKFGKELDFETDTIFPGDIIQFERVKLKYIKNGVTYHEEMKHHTAIIYEVLGKGAYTLAHQNTGFSGKKVGLSEIDLETIKRGRIKLFRPTI